MVDLAFKFLEYALLYFQAYHDIREPMFPLHDWPRYFMLCHTVELALKAYLCAEGVAEKDLKDKFGHDLDSLINEAIARHLPLDTSKCDRLRHLNDVHVKFRARYPWEWKEGESVKIATTFAPDARELLEAVAKRVRGY